MEPTQPSTPGFSQPQVVYMPGGGTSTKPFTLRFKTQLTRIVSINLALAIAIFVLGLIALLVAVGGGSAAGFEGATFWGGAFMIITSALGLAGALKQNRCLLIAYLVMVIISVSFFGPAIFGSSVAWAVSNSVGDGGSGLVVFFEALISIISLVFIVLGIAAASFLCYSVCGKSPGCCCVCCQGSQEDEIDGYQRLEGTQTPTGPGYGYTYAPNAPQAGIEVGAVVLNATGSGYAHALATAGTQGLTSGTGATVPGVHPSAPPTYQKSQEASLFA